MTGIPLAFDIVAIFCLIAGLHWHYGNWRKQHILVTLTTFVAWYFPFMIIFVMPIDVSNVSSYLISYSNFMLCIDCFIRCLVILQRNIPPETQ